MTSAFTVSPAALVDGRMPDTHNGSPPRAQPHMQSNAPLDSSHLSPFASHPVHSNSASPTQNIDTPAESPSTLSHYQTSDLSDFEGTEDPFFGVDFGTVEGSTPIFLDDPIPGLSHTNSFGQSSAVSSFPSSPPVNNHAANGSTYPLSPEQVVPNQASLPRKVMTRPPAPRMPDSVSPHELQMPFNAGGVTATTQSAPQPTPSNSGSGRSSEDGLAPAHVAMPCQSPRVTVSYWGKDDTAPVQAVERSFAPDGTVSPTTVRGGVESAGDLISSNTPNTYTAPVPRDDMGRWQRDSTTGHRGHDPDNRPSDQIDSVNEIMSKREIAERNVEVGKWLSQSRNPLHPNQLQERNVVQDFSNVKTAEIPIGGDTENKYEDGQIYFIPNGGPLSQEDINIINQNQHWADRPQVQAITSDPELRFQPATSMEAMERFERQMQDNESIISKAATWGTRRRSLPSLLDVEVITSGNLLKKLSIKHESRKPAFIHAMQELRGLARKRSVGLKRARSGHDEESFKTGEVKLEKRDSVPHLAPPSRSGSWGLSRKPTPSINTALVAVGGSAASIGSSQHARSGSISATSITSPKSPFAGLSVRTPLGRPRSKSDLPKHAGLEGQSNLAEMWRKSGGPPIPSLGKPVVALDLDDDDDDDDDFYEDGDMKAESSKMIDDITPTFSGFQEHILRLNPGLAHSNVYIVDRIAQQQIIRYKSLLNAKVKHLQQGANCPCGILCITLGGTATILDQKGEVRGVDPLATRYDGSDGDVTPIEGAITQESFPPDIPKPPTNSLPAEFECQLCFQAKKFQKPSDWTKHVHEDVQPFTCTWDKCKEPKIFKRKADWVRHENEGHRHLEWWTCDVDDCRHTCYRRDNFLQHLVREHKFPEPKVKTKAAMKRAGGIDPTWQKVEKCHEEATKKSQEEPCRFCSKTFPSWKKLTVHLAKHMEQISLPVLRLVAAKELGADTVISPVQDPPARSFAQSNVKREQAPTPYAPAPQFNGNAGMGVLQQQGGLAYAGSNPGYVYPVMPTDPQFGQPFYGGAGYDGIGHNLGAAAMMTYAPASNYHGGQQFPDIPVTAASFGEGQTGFAAAGFPAGSPQGVGAEPFPNLGASPLGLQTGQMGQMGGHLAAQMGYDGLMDPASAASVVESYTPQGSVSPYSHSPHQGQPAFYPPQ